jgi:hypothetical protein
MSLITFRPLGDNWPGEPTPASRRRSHYVFQARWPTIIGDLSDELAAIRARNATIRLRLSERDIRKDGWPRVDAVPAGPAVQLDFDKPGTGPLSFACDTYDHWQANVRAISLTLAALRGIDRWGAVRPDQQYTGFKALPKPDNGAGMTAEQAARLILDAGRVTFPESDASPLVTLILTDPAARARYLRLARRTTHPDNRATGNADLFARLAQAATVLDTQQTVAGQP